MADYNVANPKRKRRKIKGNNPRKHQRPISQMAPSLVIDRITKQVVGVFGGTGGKKIPNAIATLIINHYFNKKSLQSAVNSFRMFNFLKPSK